MWQRTVDFFKDVRAEMKKISWPTRHELRESTVVVIVTVIIITIFIGAIDRLFNLLLQALAKTL